VVDDRVVANLRPGSHPVGQDEEKDRGRAIRPLIFMNLCKQSQKMSIFAIEMLS
jgi:hypothetical protein